MTQWTFLLYTVAVKKQTPQPWGIKERGKEVKRGLEGPGFAEMRLSKITSMWIISVWPKILWLDHWHIKLLLFPSKKWNPDNPFISPAVLSVSYSLYPSLSVLFFPEHFYSASSLLCVSVSPSSSPSATICPSFSDVQTPPKRFSVSFVNRNMSPLRRAGCRGGLWEKKEPLESTRGRIEGEKMGEMKIQE